MADGALVFSFAILGLFVRGCVQFHALFGRKRFAAFVAGERMVIDHNVVTG